MMGYCTHSNKDSGSTKCGQFIDQLMNCSLMKKKTAQWKFLTYDIIPQKTANLTERHLPSVGSINL